MINMMLYYNFDGWFINQETATNATTAVLMHNFVRDLTAQAELIGKEVMWYDAMRLNGSVGWQNRLTINNSPFVQDDQDIDGSFETRVSSSIFINFGWGSSTFPTASRTRAMTIGRLQFDVFTGADIWPGRNQGNFETNGNTFMSFLHENATTPFTSLGLFAPNCVFNNSIFTNFNNDPTDVASFYNAENHLFSGDDNNASIVDATGFKGLSNWIPEASVVNGPFVTDFCTGHGTKKFSEGVPTSSNSWHDMNKQDVLPSWQWAFSLNTALRAEWDFADAWNGGSSVKIKGDLLANTSNELMLYKTKILITPATRMELTYKCNSEPLISFLIVFSDDSTTKYYIGAGGGLNPDWTKLAISLSSFAGREIAMIGLRYSTATNILDYQMNLGNLILFEDPNMATVENSKSNAFVTISYPIDKDSLILFNINWPNSKQLHYSVTDMQGTIVKESAISLITSTNFPFQTNGMTSGTYIVKFTDQSNHSETRKFLIK